jgi:hypothetical protein
VQKVHVMVSLSILCLSWQGVAQASNAISGNACRAYHGSDIASFQSDAAKFKRLPSTGGSTKPIICPFHFETWDTGTTFATAVGVSRSSGTVTCTLAAYSQHGAYLSVSNSQSLSAGTFAELSLSITIPSGTRTVMVYCELPEGGAVHYYEYDQI